MRLGFYTDYSREIAEFAERVGFNSLELSAWPEATLNADTVSAQTISEIQKDLEKRDIEISSLGYYPNYLDPDPEVRKETQRYFIKVMELAQRMNLTTVCTFAGREPGKSVVDNIPLFKEVFSRFCDEAEKRDLRIAIENCPMMERIPLQGTNIAFSPEIWDMMFEVVPSDRLGLEIDPSHMVWLGIDYVKAVYDYADRIFHVHAKDMEILPDVLGRVGIYGQIFGEVKWFGSGWWRARTPGWGEIDWPKFITALIEVEYAGSIDIEHEDDVFAASTSMDAIEKESDIVGQYGREQRGLALGYNTLAPLIL